MSISGISFGGLASGLDTQAIIQALLAVEQRPITLLQNQRTSFQNQRSLFSELETRLQTLQDAADALNDPSSFLEYAVKLSDPTIASASIGSGAAVGVHDLTVKVLAASQVSESAAYATNTGAVITGSAGSKLTFTVGANAPVDVTLDSSYTLQQAADAINAANAGVTASVVQTGASAYKLVVTGAEGAANAFTVTGTGTASVTALANALNTNKSRAAKDAEVVVDGVTVSSASNSITAIPGVTLDLLDRGTTKVSVNADTDATADKVEAMVDAYNAVVDFLAEQSEFDPATNTASSPLFGDSSLRTVRTNLRSIAGSSVTTGNPAYDSLAMVGIDANRDGRLTLDRTAFQSAVVDDGAAVQTLFTDPTSGVAQRLVTTTGTYLDTVNGLLVTRMEGYDDRIASTDEQIRRAEQRLEQLEQALVQRFANLETLLGQLQSQGNALAALNLGTNS